MTTQQAHPATDNIFPAGQKKNRGYDGSGPGVIIFVWWATYASQLKQHEATKVIAPHRNYKNERTQLAYDSVTRLRFCKVGSVTFAIYSVSV